MKKSIQSLLLLTSLLTLAACDPDDDFMGPGKDYSVIVSTDGKYYQSSGGEPCGSGNSKYVCLKFATGQSIIAPKQTPLDIVGTYSMRNQDTQKWVTKNIYESPGYGTQYRAINHTIRFGNPGYIVDAVKINLNVIGYYNNKTFSKEFSFSNETVWDMATGVAGIIGGTGASVRSNCYDGECKWFIELKNDLILTQDDSYSGKTNTVNDSSRGNAKSDISGRSSNQKASSSQVKSR